MLRTFSPRPPSLHWHWIEIAGPDARDYLHRISTVDINALEAGRGASGCLLTAQGKLRAWFHVWRLDAERFGFELDGGANGKWRTLFIEAIEQLHFAEKFDLIEPTGTGLQVRWLFPENGAPLPSELAPGRMAAAGGVRYLHHGSVDYGRPWISAWGAPSALPAAQSEVGPGASPEVSYSELERWRIAALRPRIGAEIDESTIPLEVGLIDALAGGKGCYPGQEVIERTVSLGSPARRLARIELSGPSRLLTPGEPLVLVGPGGEPGPEIGRVTSATPGRALALLRKMHAKEGLEVQPASGAPGGRVSALAAYKA